MAAGDSRDSSRSTSSNSASGASSPFDPNKVLDDFNERLRALNRPLDLSISQETLNANTAMFQGQQVPVAPSAAAARAEKRWQMDDVVDVEDISERTASVALPEHGRASEFVDEVLPALGESSVPPASSKRRSREYLPWVEELDLAAERAEAARLELALARSNDLALSLQICQDELGLTCQALQAEAERGLAQAVRESQALYQRLRWPVLVNASLSHSHIRIAAWRAALGEALVRADSLAEHALKDQQRVLLHQVRERLALAAAVFRLEKEQAERQAQAQALERAMQEARAAELQCLLQQQISQAQAKHQAEVESIAREALLAYKKAQALSRRRATLAVKKLVKEAQALREAQALAAEKADKGERTRFAREEAAVAAAVAALNQEQEAKYLAAGQVKQEAARRAIEQAAVESAEREVAACLAAEQATQEEAERKARARATEEAAACLAAQKAAENSVREAAERAATHAIEEAAREVAQQAADRAAQEKEGAERQAVARFAAELAAREVVEQTARRAADLAAEAATAAQKLRQEQKTAAERAAAERAAAERAAAERAAAERAAAERAAAERAAAERAAAERAAAERAAAERAAAERAAAERAAAERAAAERAAAERAAAERAAAERAAAERAAAERAAAERAAAERAAALKAQVAEVAAASAAARLEQEARAEREGAELAAFLHIDLKVYEPNAESESFDLGRIQMPVLPPAQEFAGMQQLDFASLQLHQSSQATPDLDLGALGELGQMLAKVAQSSRLSSPEPEALDLHLVAEAAQLRRSSVK